MIIDGTHLAVTQPQNSGVDAPNSSSPSSSEILKAIAALVLTIDELSQKLGNATPEKQHNGINQYVSSLTKESIQEDIVLYLHQLIDQTKDVEHILSGETNLKGQNKDLSLMFQFLKSGLSDAKLAKEALSNPKLANVLGSMLKEEKALQPKDDSNPVQIEPSHHKEDESASKELLKILAQQNHEAHLSTDTSDAPSSSKS